MVDMDRILTHSGRADLLRRHRHERDGRVKDRMKVVLLRDDGWSYASIAEALFLSEEGVRQQLIDYVESDGKKLKPENGGTTSPLNEAQTLELVQHLEAHLYVKASDICAYVLNTYGVRYTVSGMTDWLKDHKFTFHQPCGVPAKANAEAQEKFVAEYEKLKRDLPDDDHILFMDGVHPTHTVRFTRGWIKKGVRKEIPTNSGHKRLNILGALNLAEMALYARHYDTINGGNIIVFLTYLLTVIPRGIIHIILDQAGYHTCNEVKAWLLLNPRVRLHYLPPYSPNLNSIEPCWKIMHEHTTNNVFSPTFKDFTEKIEEFFRRIFPEKAKSWTDRLTDNFRIMGARDAA
jgi:transposase